MRELRNAGDRAAYKDEAAVAKSNALSSYGSSKRTPEDLKTLWAASPEAAAEIEKTAGTAALTTARTDTATAQTKKAELEGHLKQVELGSQFLAGVKDEASYQAALAQSRAAQLDVSDAPEHYFPDWVQRRQQQGLKAKDQLGLQLQSLNVDSQIANRDASTGIAQGRAAETARHNLVQEGKKPGNGLSITGYDEQGRPLIQVGGSSAPFSKPTVGKLEETQVQGMEGLARLDNIKRVMKPELLTYGSKLKDWGLDFKSKLGMELDPEQQKFRNEYTDMRQLTMVNLNKTIKDQTGATVAVDEVPRIASTVPTMDDAPDQFPRKAKNADRLLRNSMIRAQIAREAGMDPLQSGIDLGDTKTLIDKRGEQLTRQLTARSQGMAPADIQALVDKRLKEEFGL